MHPRLRTFVLDLALVAALAMASVLLGADPFPHTAIHDKMVGYLGSADQWRLHIGLWWLAAGLLAAAAFVRRDRPLTALVLAVAGTASHLSGWPASQLTTPLKPGSGLGHELPLLPLDLLVLVVIYTVAGSLASRRLSIALLLTIEAGLGVIAMIEPLNAARHDLGPRKEGDVGNIGNTKEGEAQGAAVWKDALRGGLSDMAIPALVAGIAWAAGDNARTRRAHLAVLQARAADLEREQEQRTALAVATERGRITRELHDVVAHGLSVMVIQAQGAQAALHRHPERSETALRNVITTGRASLAEMRRLLGLVSPGGQLAPQPSLAALPELIDGVRASGRPVAFDVTGDPATLPAGIELSVYRIVQEALTNTLKHAEPGCSCSVGLDFAGDRVRIRVHDTGTTVRTPVYGNGLRGITERVAALGGTVHAGPAEHGGFEVTTELPLAAPA
ncbi:sensor histidine kinase [Actinomadura scrupuli]|uniref:sensor histidine kinase n=1 Tax=Actinomadura scrupuli TaxID=559629 RepID=UPI003D99311D